MIDKNGIEIKTGMIVEITGAYFKNDNALYFVTNSPGDPSWCGSDHSLKRISKAGKISADNLRAHIKREVWDFGEDSKTVKKDRAILAHYEAVAAGLREEGPDAQISQESQGR